jgi:glycosyltransferase involved in cell wall biosynthesis
MIQEESPRADSSAIDISIVVPSLNEESSLPSLVENVRRVLLPSPFSFEILLVDDCSDDRTLEVAQELSRSYLEVQAVTKFPPRGMGHTIRHGVAKARGKMSVVVMADGVDPLETILLFAKEVLLGRAQLGLLCRYQNPQDHAYIPLSYRISHLLFRGVTRGLLGIPFRDTTYAFRAFDTQYFRELEIVSGGFEISPEVTFKCWFNGARICEVPGRQTARTTGQSKFVFSRAGWGYARIFWRALQCRLTGKWPSV